jgi:hypothetical protein
MMETSGLSNWLTSLLKPMPAPAPAPSAPAPAFEHAPVAEAALTAAPGPHPNLVALYDRARAREAALVQERLAMEPKVMAAFGMLGALLIGTAIAGNHLVWGLTQWHSPWHVALVAIPNVVAVGLLVRGAMGARRVIDGLLAERKFPFAAQAGLSDPLACVDKDPDGWLTALIQDVHAANNAHDLSLKKQQERFAQLVRLLTRLALVLAVQTGYNAVWQQAAQAAPKPGQPNVGVTPAPIRAVPTPSPVAPTPSPTATATAPATGVSPTAASTLRPAGVASAPAVRVRRVLPTTAPRLAATAQPAATPTPLPTETVKPIVVPSPKGPRKGPEGPEPLRVPLPAAKPAVPTTAPVAPEKKPAVAPAQSAAPATAPNGL